MAPITIQGKLLLRQLTSDSTDWDVPLLAEKEAEWTMWRDSLQELAQFETPQAYTAVSVSTAQHIEVHVFSDASVKAIAAVAYLKVIDREEKCYVDFIMGKAKLAPISVHTIPRLELGAAVLAVELAELVVSKLDMKPNSLQFYTDSNVVNVERIRKLSHPEQWHYVLTEQNPADVATRLVTPAQLLCTIWLAGLDFLSCSMEKDNSTMPQLR